MNNLEAAKVEYLIKQAKDLISYFKSNGHRWTQMLSLEIDKIITLRASMVSMSQILWNDNLDDAIESLDKYLIDLEYLKKYDTEIGQLIGRESYKNFNIKGKTKHIKLNSEYDFNNRMNHRMMLTTLVEYKNKISKLEIVGLLREILLRLNIDEKFVDTRIKQEFKIKNKKFENIKYKVIYVNGSCLSLPLEDLKTEFDYDIYIAVMESIALNSKEKKQTISIHPQVSDFDELEEILFIHRLCNVEYIYTKDIKDYYDKLS